MAQIFPVWTNRLPLLLAAAAIVIGAAAVLGVWYYGSPRYTDVGYRPVQPVAYSHKLHAGDLGIDCRYCHTAVEQSRYATVPPTQTCMNCHKLILPESQKLLPVRESFATGRPIEWVRIHKMPDYAYFDHARHVQSGVGCFSCHGNVAQMEVVEQVQPLSMSWCLSCHRNPAPHLRPLDQITNMTWAPAPDHADWAERFMQEHHIRPSEDCWTCHR
ncbi:MAG: cytochrome c3 family protein [candidate division Zixibacteria bacterium]|nr:cytochrome c3 family protein [candidate division Zixibacteria bacterium]